MGDYLPSLLPTDLIAMNFSTFSFYAGLFAVLALLLTACAEEPAATPINVVETSIADVHRAILTGATTCRMVVQSHLDRIDIYEDQINAITVLNPNALTRADEIDAAVADLLRADRLLKASPHTDEHFVEEWLLATMARAQARAA